MKKCKECGCKFDPDDAVMQFEYEMEEFELGNGGSYEDLFPKRNFCGDCAVQIARNWIAVGREEEEGGDWD